MTRRFFNAGERYQAARQAAQGEPMSNFAEVERPNGPPPDDEPKPEPEPEPPPPPDVAAPVMGFTPQQLADMIATAVGTAVATAAKTQADPLADAMKRELRP